MRKDCRFCHKEKFKLILDLGLQPLAGDFLTKKQLNKEKFYKLRLYRCESCGLTQLLDVVPKEELFQSYLSSVTLAEHFIKYAWEMKKRFLKPGDFVVEIGSNDGVLLEPLQKLGIKVLGIEPVKEIADIAQKKGIPTKVAYFTEQLAKTIHTKAKAIFANNVFAHIDDMDDVMQGIQHLLAVDGIFVFENHFLLNVLAEGQFDGIYHERLNYYTISALVPFLKKYGFEIFEVRPIPTHGGSIRVYTKRLLDIDFDNFSYQIYRNKQQLLEVLEEFKHRSKRIIGFGAAGRANTLLNFYGIGTKYLEYIIDESPSRFGKFTPGMHIPVIPLTEVKFQEVDYIVILAWNYQEQIIQKCKQAGYTGNFILPLPKVQII